MKHKAKVVMLPTSATTGCIAHNKVHSFFIWTNTHITDNVVKNLVEYRDTTFSHIYIIVSHDVEPIIAGDWFHNTINQMIFKAPKEWTNTSGVVGTSLFKIIATTDRELTKLPKLGEGWNNKEIPNVSISFLKSICNLDYIVNDVMVEYDCLTATRPGILDLSKNPCWEQIGESKCMEWKLKVSQNNVIFTSPIELMMYTEEEVEEILLDYREYAWKIGTTLKDLTKWMRTNLKHRK